MKSFILKTCERILRLFQVSYNLLLFSVAVVPPSQFRGNVQTDGFLNPDAYWHGEILELRRRKSGSKVGLGGSSGISISPSVRFMPIFAGSGERKTLMVHMAWQ